MRQIRAGRAIAPDDLEFCRDLTKGTWSMFCCRQKPCFLISGEIKPQEFAVKSNTPLWISSSPPTPRVHDSSCCSSKHYLIQTRLKFTCQCAVQVTDNSWELHAQSSNAVCPGIVRPFPLGNLKPVFQFATVTAAQLFLLCVGVCARALVCERERASKVCSLQL